MKPGAFSGTEPGSARSTCTRPCDGFSLVEILIAFALLSCCALALIMTFREGATRQESFTAEHFTAMFLSQKIIEDVNHRIKENPHEFTRFLKLASSMPDQKVVEGGSEFFRLLENTRDLTRLLPSEDEPILASWGSTYRQLKPFTCRIETSFVPNPEVSGESLPNLLELKVFSKWRIPGREEEAYEMGQLLAGESDEILKSESPIPWVPIRENAAVKALWTGMCFSDPNPPTTLAGLKRFTKGGEEEILRAVGGIFLVASNARELTSATEKKLFALTVKRNMFLASPDSFLREKAVEIQEDMIFAAEDLAIGLFTLLNQLEPEVEKISRMGLDTSTVGPKVAEDLVLLGFAIQNLLKSSLLIPGAFGALEAGYQELFSPPMESLVPPRRRNRLLRRWLDARKVVTLFASGKGKDAGKVQGQTLAFIRTLQDSFKGYQPVFEDYLKVEADLNQSIPHLEKEMAVLVGEIRELDQTTHALEEIGKSVFAPSTK